MLFLFSIILSLATFLLPQSVLVGGSVLFEIRFCIFLKNIYIVLLCTFYFSFNDKINKFINKVNLY